MFVWPRETSGDFSCVDIIGRMKPTQIRLREFFWLTLAMALALGWLIDHRRQAARYADLVEANDALSKHFAAQIGVLQEGNQKISDLWNERQQEFHALKRQLGELQQSPAVPTPASLNPPLK